MAWTGESRRAVLAAHIDRLRKDKAACRVAGNQGLAYDLGVLAEEYEFILDMHPDAPLHDHLTCKCGSCRRERATTK